MLSIGTTGVHLLLTKNSLQGTVRTIITIIINAAEKLQKDEINKF